MQATAVVVVLLVLFCWCCSAGNVLVVLLGWCCSAGAVLPVAFCSRMICASNDQMSRLAGAAGNSNELKAGQGVLMPVVAASQCREASLPSAAAAGAYADHVCSWSVQFGAVVFTVSSHSGLLPVCCWCSCFYRKSAYSFVAVVAPCNHDSVALQLSEKSLRYCMHMCHTALTLLYILLCRTSCSQANGRQWLQSTAVSGQHACKHGSTQPA